MKADDNENISNVSEYTPSSESWIVKGSELYAEMLEIFSLSSVFVNHSYLS